MTGMDIPCSGFGGETSDAGGLSMNTRTGCLGGLILLKKKKKKKKKRYRKVNTETNKTFK